MSTNASTAPLRGTRRRWLVLTAIAAVALLLAAALFADGSPLREWFAASEATAPPAEDEHAGHDHAGHDDPDTIRLSPQARKNIGLKTSAVELQTFWKTISIPAVTVPSPGKSEFDVAAPMTGTVIRVLRSQGEAIQPGEPLFELRLTHEDVVQSQTELLRTVEELDVLQREIARLEEVTRGGAVAGKTLLERKYELQKAEGVLRAQREALMLHGLSAEQVQQIIDSRSLLQRLTVRAPTNATPKNGQPLQLQAIVVQQGEHVETGATLAQVIDHSHLQLEGSAFAEDVSLISEAAANRWPVTAIAHSQSGEEARLEGLSIVYVANQVDRDSRAFHFYVSLPNEIVRRTEHENGSYVHWKYRPGERMELLVPVEQMPERIVLPIEAIADDGAETYAFVGSKSRFKRREIHVEYRDRNYAILANDGALKPGDTVVTSGAFQLQQAMKNRQAGPIDPHAGHNH